MIDLPSFSAILGTFGYFLVASFYILFLIFHIVSVAF